MVQLRGFVPWKAVWATLSNSLRPSFTNFYCGLGVEGAAQERKWLWSHSLDGSTTSCIINDEMDLERFTTTFKDDEIGELKIFVLSCSNAFRLSPTIINWGLDNMKIRTEQKSVSASNMGTRPKKKPKNWAWFFWVELKGRGKDSLLSRTQRTRHHLMER